MTQEEAANESEEGLPRRQSRSRKHCVGMEAKRKWGFSIRKKSVVWNKRMRGRGPWNWRHPEQ